MCNIRLSALCEIANMLNLLMNLLSRIRILRSRAMRWGWLHTLLGLGLMLYFSVAPALIFSLEAAPLAIEGTPQEIGKAVNTLFDQAFEATSRGDFGSAEALWTEILARYPNNAAVWSNRGNARVSQRKLQEAIADYNQSIALAPDQPDPYLNRGTALEGLQQWDAAIADYNQVLAIEPKDPAAYNNRGNAKAGAGDWEAALTDYQTAAELNPGFAMAQANCALALYQLGQTDASMRRFRNLVRKYPQFADMRAAFAAALWTQGQQGEAESQWVSVVGLDSRYRDLDWVRTIRRWPPHLVDALAQFLSLQSNG
jgi:tetratricopeptide (TPR) repeat protein